MKLKTINLLALPILLLGQVVAASPRDLIGQRSDLKDQLPNPEPGLFSVCYQHTCAEIDHISLTNDQWNQVRSFFDPAATSAKEERQQIANAISYLEIEVGKKINALDDRGGNLEGFTATGNQLDCIDESTNSTTYMTMMENDGLLRFHQVEKRATRGFLIIGGWPHTTAVISEKHSDRKWAVDSWFRDNGVEPDIVPLKEWRRGWRPDKS